MEILQSKWHVVTAQMSGGIESAVGSWRGQHRGVGATGGNLEVLATVRGSKWAG